MEYMISEEQGFSDFFYCEHLQSPNFPPHIHSHIEFIYLLKGQLTLNISQNNYILEPNSAAVIFPYEIHGYCGDSEAAALVLACPLEYLPEYRHFLTSHHFNPPVIPIQAVHKVIAEDIIAGCCADELKMKALLYYTISELLRLSKPEQGRAFEYDLYRRAIMYISEHYREPLTLEQTARYVGVSTSHLSRVLHADGKPGFSEILNALRVHAAKTMLEQEDTSISEAALSAGFGSIRNFNRIYKKFFGGNPSQAKQPGSV